MQNTLLRRVNIYYQLECILGEGGSRLWGLGIFGSCTVPRHGVIVHGRVTGEEGFMYGSYPDTL